MNQSLKPIAKENNVLSKLLNECEFKTLKQFMKRIANDSAYPNWGFHGYFEKLVPSKAIRDKLCEEKIFIHLGQNSDGYDVYTLGAAGIQLVSSWQTEELTRDVHAWTGYIFRLTIFLVIIGLLQLFATVVSIVLSARGI